MQSLTDFAVERLVLPHNADLAEPSCLELCEGGALLIRVHGEVMVQRGGWAVDTGTLRVEPGSSSLRRLAESVDGSAFDRCVGQGLLLRAPATRRSRFELIRLERDACYFRPTAVIAFNSHLQAEMGIIPGTRDGFTLPAIRLSGQGVVALELRGAIVSVKVTAQNPLRVAASALLGWIGQVVVTGEATSGRLVAEGDGAVLVSLLSEEEDRLGEAD